MIVNENIPTTGKALIASTSTTSYAVTSLFLCNVSTTDTENVSVYAVKSGGTVSDDALILKDCIIDPTDTFVFNMEKLILENGDYVYAISDLGNATGVVSVMEI